MAEGDVATFVTFRVKDNTPALRLSKRTVRRKLSDNFELCVYGLGYARADPDRLRDPRFQAVKGHLLG